MYISSKFRCQLSFNWHLNLIEGCATPPGFYNTAKKITDKAFNKILSMIN
jgi:hypothetical protein